MNCKTIPPSLSTLFKEIEYGLFVESLKLDLQRKHTKRKALRSNCVTNRRELYRYNR